MPSAEYLWWHDALAKINAALDAQRDAGRFADAHTEWCAVVPLDAPPYPARTIGALRIVALPDVTEPGVRLLPREREWRDFGAERESYFEALAEDRADPWDCTPKLYDGTGRW